MTKVIENIELLKKLQPYIEEKEPHPEYGFYSYCDDLGKIDPVYKKVDPEFGKYRVPRLFTLTLEEATEFILNRFQRVGFTKRIKGDKDAMCFPYGIYVGLHYHNIDDMVGFKTKIEAITEMLEYLIDNNLLEND